METLSFNYLVPSLLFINKALTANIILLVNNMENSIMLCLVYCIIVTC